MTNPDCWGDTPPEETQRTLAEQRERAVVCPKRNDNCTHPRRQKVVLDTGVVLYHYCPDCGRIT